MDLEIYFNSLIFDKSRRLYIIRFFFLFNFSSVMCGVLGRTVAQQIIHSTVTIGVLDSNLGSEIFVARFDTSLQGEPSMVFSRFPSYVSLLHSVVCVFTYGKWVLGWNNPRSSCRKLEHRPESNYRPLFEIDRENREYSPSHPKDNLIVILSSVERWHTHTHLYILVF